MLIAVDCLQLNGVDKYSFKHRNKMGDVYGHAVENARKLPGENVIIGIVSSENKHEFAQYFDDVICVPEFEKTVRWKDVAHCLTKSAFCEDLEDILLLAPALGIVTFERMRKVMDGAVQDSIRISCCKRLPDMHPMWQTGYKATGGILPDVIEVTDVAPLKPSIEEVPEKYLCFLPGLEKINGSHDLPQLINVDAAIVWIPQSLSQKSSILTSGDYDYALVDVESELLIHRLKVFEIDFDNPDLTGSGHG